MSKICATQPNITGGYLKKYLRPPKVFHDMNVSELLWRASMSPRILEYPIHLVPKVAFMFLTKGPVHLALLWENFFKGHQGLYSIYVHSSPSYEAASHPESPVFHERRIPSQVIKTCIPLYNFSTVYSYLINSTRTFVEVFDDPSSVGRGRYYLSNYTRITVDQWRKGWAWFAIDREVAIESISDRKYFPEFLKCKGYCFPDEHYLPTFVHLKFAARNANRTLTWVDWSKGGPHPTEYRSPNLTAALLSSLRSGYGRKCEYNGRSTDVCFLFARKFMPDTLDKLLRLATQIMYFST
nr:glycosyltransferase BC10-like [Malus domestica]